MDEIITNDYWETLSIRKGYRLLVQMGMDKRKARIEAIKGVRVYTLSSMKTKK